jgi:hypothetical protein
MSIMGLHILFGIWNTSYGQKKGRESNCQFDSWPEKIESRPDLLDYRGRATYRWKDLNDRYNFALGCIAIWSLFTKWWGSKVTIIPTGMISGLPLGSPRREKSFGWRLCGQPQSILYKGEGGDFPQVRAVMSLVCPCCSWLVLAPKVLQLCINHFVWVVCRPVWVSEACQLFLSHPGAPTRPSTLQSVVS